MDNGRFQRFEVQPKGAAVAGWTTEKGFHIRALFRRRFMEGDPSGKGKPAFETLPQALPQARAALSSKGFLQAGWIGCGHDSRGEFDSTVPLL